MLTYLVISLVYIFTFVVGNYLEKVRIPWIFAALLLGLIFSPLGMTFSSTFKFLASLGMYFLLFIIGFEIDLKEIKREGRYILSSTVFITIFAGICGAFIVYYFFNLGLIVSFLVGLSFATVGEAVLVPILDEFKLVNSKLGRSLIGIGVVDDIFEVFTLVLAASVIGTSMHTSSNFSVTVLSLSVLFIFAYFLNRMKKSGRKFKNFSIETLFLFTMFVFFLFIGLGKYADLDALAALLAGIVLKNFIPRERLMFIENEIKAVCYGLFAPLFFFWVGVSTSMKYLLYNPYILLLFFIVSGGAKIIASYITARKRLGRKGSLLLGIGLSVRFSTSIVIAKYLFEYGLIPSSLYSVIVASTALFTLIIPISFAWLIQRWKYLLE